MSEGKNPATEDRERLERYLRSRRAALRRQAARRQRLSRYITVTGLAVIGLALVTWRLERGRDGRTPIGFVRHEPPQSVGTGSHDQMRAPLEAARLTRRWSDGHRLTRSRVWRYGGHRAPSPVSAPAARTWNPPCRHDSLWRLCHRFPRITRRYPIARSGSECRTRHGAPIQKYQRNLRLQQPPYRPAWRIHPRRSGAQLLRTPSRMTRRRWHRHLPSPRQSPRRSRWSCPGLVDTWVKLPPVVLRADARRPAD
jgi:hypothetical protein